MSFLVQAGGDGGAILQRDVEPIGIRVDDVEVLCDGALIETLEIEDVCHEVFAHGFAQVVAPARVAVSFAGVPAAPEFVVGHGGTCAGFALIVPPAGWAGDLASEAPGVFRWGCCQAVFSTAGDLGLHRVKRSRKISFMGKKDDTQELPNLKSEKVEGFSFVESGTISAYQMTYDRIFWDLDHALSELAGPQIDFANLIHAAAHLRLVLERVTTASFIAAYNIFLEAQENVTKAKDFGEVRKKLKKLNSNYWPVAFGQVTHDGNTGLGVLPNVGVQETDVGRIWGNLSGILHAPNPFKEKTFTPDLDFTMLKDLASDLEDLLRSHIVQLADSSEVFYLRRLPDGEIAVQAFKTGAPLL